MYCITKQIITNTLNYMATRAVSTCGNGYTLRFSSRMFDGKGLVMVMARRQVIHTTVSKSIAFCPGRYLEGALGKSLLQNRGNCSKLFSLA